VPLKSFAFINYTSYRRDREGNQRGVYGWRPAFMSFEFRARDHITARKPERRREPHNVQIARLSGSPQRKKWQKNSIASG
jgi:hypothetical protein